MTVYRLAVGQKQLTTDQVANGLIAVFTFAHTYLSTDSALTMPM
jgi:hypothetical protein